MKIKSEILAMSKDELINYKWSDDLNIPKETNYKCSDCYNCSDCYKCSDCSDCYNCSDCYKCSDCSNCSNCYNCSDCLYCRNLKNKNEGYWICNVEVTEEEFEEKKKEMEK